MRGLVRSAAVTLLVTAAAFRVEAHPKILPAVEVQRGKPGAAAFVSPLAKEVTERRLEAWRSVPHLISRPGHDWSPSAHRRAGWQPGSASRSTFHSAVAGRNRATGGPDVYNVAFFRVEFENDRDGSLSTGNGRFNLNPADTIDNPVDRPPHNRTFYRKHHEALARYYDAQSYGRVQITGEVFPRAENEAYRVSDMADFGPWRFNRDIADAAVQMFHTMMDSIHVQAKRRGEPIPWNTIDKVVIIHAGSDLQSDLRSDSKHDIPSFTLGVVDSEAVVFEDVPDMRPISQMAIFPETQNQDGFYGALNGVIAHECGHLILGYADLYDFNTGLPVVGLFSLMDSGNLAGALFVRAPGDTIFVTGLLPPSVDPFHKAFTGDAVNFLEMSYGTLDSLKNVQRNPDMRVLTQSSDELVILENRYLTPVHRDSVRLDTDDTTKVVLGPRNPDRYEYDALIPGGGVLMWHVDLSVIPLTTSLRPNPDFGVNTNRNRLGVSLLEADGLRDIGDPGSPFILGSYRDPWYVGNNTVITDRTVPSLISNLGTRSHARIEVLDTLLATMRFQADRDWRLPGWPVITTNLFPPGGPQLLAVDLDGDTKLEVCWAGGDSAQGDSTSIPAFRHDGTPFGGGSIASLPRRPIPMLAALPTGGPDPEDGPSLVAVTTAIANPPQIQPGEGELWIFDHFGLTPTGTWPPPMGAARATTPPVFIGTYPNAAVAVGANDGYVYVFGLDGALLARSAPALGGPVSGRLAVWNPGTPSSGGPDALIAAGSSAGDVGVFSLSLVAAALPNAPGWPRQVLAGTPFVPDFLWVDLDGRGSAAGHPSTCGGDAPELVVHHADRVWAFCLAAQSFDPKRSNGIEIPGWGKSYGDTIAAGLGAGDPDGDGLPEVLIQTHDSKVAFLNANGSPSPGWPKPSSPEGVLYADSLLTGEHFIERFPTRSPPLALDLESRGRADVVALNVSGSIVALRADGTRPEGWPLASGAGVSGAPLAADLDRDGRLDLIVPDRFGTLFGYALPTPAGLPATSWTMVGGDPQRTSALPDSRTPVAAAIREGPVVPGSVIAFPNPARRSPVRIAYTLTEPARVEVRVLDTSGLEVASFHRDAPIAENLDVWHPGSAPAGLYMVHVRIRGARTETTRVIPVGVLK